MKWSIHAVMAVMTTVTTVSITAFSPPTPLLTTTTTTTIKTPSFSSLSQRQRHHHHHRQKHPSLSSSSQPLRQATTTRTCTTMALSCLRGGGISSASLTSAVTATVQKWTATPSSLFNTSLVALGLTTLFLKLNIGGGSKSSEDSDGKKKLPIPTAQSSLRWRFLSVFWLLRCADWLQGPYFYDVYASKIINGSPISLSLISKIFLAGFASTAALGPVAGRLADGWGRKKATMAFTLFYAMGALSTKSGILGVLFLGRFLNGVGTSLLFSAPEA